MKSMWIPELCMGQTSSQLLHSGQTSLGLEEPIFMVIHLWGKFWMAAWRGNRLRTWITGSIAFVMSIATAFTGYLIQTNFDSQWISFEAKDGFNSVGIGAFFNVTNLGQMLLLHVALLPFILGILTIVHVLMVRQKGVVPPIDADQSNTPDGGKY